MCLSFYFLIQSQRVHGIAFSHLSNLSPMDVTEPFTISVKQMRKGAGRAGLSHPTRAERKMILNPLRPTREHGECEAGGRMGVGVAMENTNEEQAQK